MSLLGAVAVDFAEQLKKRTKGWSITPLVIHEDSIPHDGVRHNSFIFVKKTPPNQSPTAFYAANPPLRNRTFLQIKQPKAALRLIGLEVQATVNYSVHLTFWRANGFIQHDAPRKRYFARYNRFGAGVEGHQALLMCQIHHVGPRRHKQHREFFKYSFDLTVPEPPERVLNLTVQVINKSYNWHGMGKKEVFGHYQFPLMVDLDGKNYVADEHHVK